MSRVRRALPRSPRAAGTGRPEGSAGARGGGPVGVAAPVVVCAPNAYKGVITAVRAAAAMARGVRRAGADPRPVPVADGGDGTLDVLLASAPAGARIERVDVTGPLGERVRARLGWTDEHTAVVELAEACGLRLLDPRGLDALAASSRGAGELAAAALDRGATRIVVGVGGSASTDGGAGLAAALGLRLLDGAGGPLPEGGAALRRLEHLDAGRLHPGLSRCRVEVAVDVRTPLLGARGAAAVFAPQKGADPAAVAVLEEGLARLAAVAERDLGVAPALRVLAGAGAAGGAGYGLAALCGAALLPGAALVADAVGLDAALRGAVLVLTGEGRLDASTAEGKGPAEVATRAARAGVACVALAGTVEAPVDPAYAEAVAVGGGPGLPSRRTAALLERAAEEVTARRLGLRRRR